MAGALDLRLAMPGLPPLTVGLSRLRTDIADWTGFWNTEFKPQFYRWMLDTFVSEGGQSGASWAPLSPAYAAWKAARFPGNGLLVRSGALKASLLSSTAPGAVFRPSQTSIVVGTTVPYAMFQQLGTAARGRASGMRSVRNYRYGDTGGGLPARPVLRVTDAFMGVLGKSLQTFVQKAWAVRRAQMASAASSVFDGNLFGLGGA